MPKAELCFNANGIQIRVTGEIEVSNDKNLREEIFAHPTRKFLQAWKENGIDNLLTVLVMKNCEAVAWTMETNSNSWITENSLYNCLNPTFFIRKSRENDFYT